MSFHPSTCLCSRLTLKNWLLWAMRVPLIPLMPRITECPRTGSVSSAFRGCVRMTNLERARKSIDVPMLNFVFPKKIPLTIRLGGILDKIVDAKYFMADMWYERIKPVTNRNFAFGLALRDGKIHQHYEACHVDSIAPCLAATDYKRPRLIYID